MAILYETQNQKLVVKGEDSLLELCIKNKIPIDHSCEGMGSCGTCRIIVSSQTESLPPRNQLEQEMADDRGFSPQERLACQTPTDVEIVFRLPGD